MSNETAQKPTLLADYRPYSHHLDKTELTFDIRSEREVRVSARLSLSRPAPAVEEGDTLHLYGNESLNLLALRLDGRVLGAQDYRRDAQGLTISGIPQSSLVLEVDVSIDPEGNTELAGLYTSGGKFCTQCESHGFRNITFFPDRPDVMSEYFTTILADGARYPQMLSNGNLIADETLADGRRRVQWHDPFRKPSYLFALVAADLAMLEDDFTTASGRRVQLQMFTDRPESGPESNDPRTAQRQLAHAMDSLKRSMRWDETRFGREYDLDLFMVVAVDDFNFGAMENKGLNIFNSKALLATPETATDGRYGRVESVVAHEYFHNWTGNRITCRDWFQLCLKEGFTVFRDQEFSADTHSRTLQRIADARFLRSVQFAEDAGPNAHPIRPDSFMTVENFYTTTIYEKGSEVIRMMHTLLGEQGFRRGSDLYFERHDGQAVTTEDFVACMRDANPEAGFDFARFERGWYHQAGTPTLSIAEDYDAAAQTYRLTLRQSCPPVPRELGGGAKIPYVIPVRIGLLDAEGADMPLALSEGTLLHGTVLLMHEAEQSFLFTGVTVRPVLSPLRNFSAPLRLDWQPSRADLASRIAHDEDGFNRWEAAQSLAVDVLKDMVATLRAGGRPEADAALGDALRAMLADPSLAPDMQAEMLSLPSHGYLSGMYADGDVDPLAIETARETLRRQLAVMLEPALADAYRRHRTPAGATYRFVHAEVARRALANMALFYLLALPDPAAYAAEARAQQRQAGNFTDELGALRALTEHHATIGGAPMRQEAMDAFYRKWERDALVIDSWLTFETSIPRPDALARTEALMGGPFPRDAINPEKLKPNKVRAILGGFTDGNPMQFHRADGRGYAFLAAQVRSLDRANPRLAARLVSPLCDFARYEAARRAQMRGLLEEIAAMPGLSVDSREIVGNALKAA